MRLAAIEYVLLALALVVLGALAWGIVTAGRHCETGDDMRSFLVRYEIRVGGKRTPRAVLVRRAGDAAAAMGFAIGKQPWRDVERVSVEPAVIIDGLVGVEVLEGVAA